MSFLSTLPSRLSSPSSLLSTVLTYRTALILLILLNLKNVPFSWQLRLFYQGFGNMRSRTHVRKALASHATDPHSIHPIFRPHTLSTRSPLYEIDHNIHKSNSTYFSDLDQSRTALVTGIYGPGYTYRQPELVAEGHKGPLAVILGSVHCSFHKEIKPYEMYLVRSRVLGWDRKWLIIGSWFVKPATKGREEVVLASALSKYVVKKGRFTVSPERCLRAAGWLPERPEEVGGSEGVSSTETPAEGLSEGTVSQSVMEGSAVVVEKLEKVASRGVDDEVNGDAAGGWDWHRIEQERQRGMKMVENWLSLDGELKEEFSYKYS